MIFKNLIFNAYGFDAEIHSDSDYLAISEKLEVDEIFQVDSILEHTDGIFAVSASIDDYWFDTRLAESGRLNPPELDRSGTFATGRTIELDVADWDRENNDEAKEAVVEEVFKEMIKKLDGQVVVVEEGKEATMNEADRIKQIEARLKATSPGRWRIVDMEDGDYFLEMSERPFGDYDRQVFADEEYPTKRADYEFAAFAKEDIEYLISAIRSK